MILLAPPLRFYRRTHRPTPKQLDAIETVGVRNWKPNVVVQIVEAVRRVADPTS